MELELTVQIWREGGQFIAHAVPLDVSSSGPTPEAARRALDEALECFLRAAAAHGTLDEVLSESGYVKRAGVWVGPDWQGFERRAVKIPA